MLLHAIMDFRLKEHARTPYLFEVRIDAPFLKFSRQWIGVLFILWELVVIIDNRSLEEFISGDLRPVFRGVPLQDYFG